MKRGRLIRSGRRGDPNATVYIVAVAEAAEAVDLISGHAGIPREEVEDLGSVSDALLNSLYLRSGEFRRL